MDQLVQMRSIPNHEEAQISHGPKLKLWVTDDTYIEKVQDSSWTDMP